MPAPNTHLSHQARRVRLRVACLVSVPGSAGWRWTGDVLAELPTDRPSQLLDHLQSQVRLARIRAIRIVDTGLPILYWDIEYAICQHQEAESWWQEGDRQARRRVSLGFSRHASVLANQSEEQGGRWRTSGGAMQVRCNWPTSCWPIAGR